MPHNKVHIRIRCRVLSVFAAAFIALALFPVGAYAAGGVPVPAHKPEAPGESSGESGFSKFTRTLLDFGSPPPTTITKLEPQPLSRSPLSDKDAGLYKAIFALQAEGDMKAADEESKKLEDMRLMGHVLYQRYMHPTAHKSSFEELRTWLELYADHPGAQKIYALATRRMPETYDGTLKTPQAGVNIVRLREPTMYVGQAYVSPAPRNKSEQKAVRAAVSKVRKRLRAKGPAEALQALQGEKAVLDAVEHDRLQAEIAAAYLYRGKIDQAYKLAQASVLRSGVQAPQSGWVAGLIAWRAGYYEQAARYFEVPARSSYASGWLGAAGSYWTARAHMRTGNVRDVSKWLKKAKKHPRTFYGLLATRALGQEFDFNWNLPTFTKEYYELLMAQDAGNRAMALVDAGQIYRAEGELLRIDVSDKSLRNALLAYAGYVNLPSLAMRLGSAMPGGEDGFYDAALYPKVPWSPKNGFQVDPALIYAIARQESLFDPTAESPSGALGLMQLMPATARNVSGNNAFRGQGRYGLLDPETNLDIAQLYIQRLFKDKSVDDDILAMIIAYNAGPGNLGKWRALWPDVEDPLLFIELLPASQTRAYVERVLANYWIYRMREKLPTPTLDAVAEGRPARYAEAQQAVNLAVR